MTSRSGNWRRWRRASMFSLHLQGSTHCAALTPIAEARASQMAKAPTTPTSGERTLNTITVRDGTQIYYKDWGAVR